MLARLLGVLLAEPLTSSDGQGSPIVWLVKWKPRPDLLPTLHGFLDGPAVRHSRAANRTWVRHPAGEKHPWESVVFHTCDVSNPSHDARVDVPAKRRHRHIDAKQ